MTDTTSTDTTEATTDRSKSPAVDGALMSALVTEHFVLQSAAGATISESGSRASIYLASLSSCLVAIGFAGSSPKTLLVLACTLFPTVFVLGWFTLVRLIDTAIESIVAQRRIEKIRRYYAGLTRSAAEYFPLEDATTGTLGVRYRARSFLFTTATMIAVVNAVLGGATTAFIVASTAIATDELSVVIGVLCGLLFLGLAIAYQESRFRPVRPA